MRCLSITPISHPLTHPFVIARGTKTTADVVHVEIRDGDQIGVGACVPYARYGETVASVCQQISSVSAQVDAGLSTDALQDALPAGAARNAVDCALWDLRAKQVGQPIWQLLDFPEPTSFPVTHQCYTLSIATPETMAAQATAAPDEILKIKCAGDGVDVARLAAIRQACPTHTILVDPNESWGPDTIHDMLAICDQHDIAFVEQPMPAENDAALLSRSCKSLICADESCHTLANLATLKTTYDMVNVKLDKTGGLTEAARMIKAAQSQGLLVMIGCMVGPEVCMAPARHLLGLVRVADLDGPMFLADR